jgi:nucleoside-diphosphate-sugar epimerase
LSGFSPVPGGEGAGEIARNSPPGRALVVGGRGFLGRHIVAALAEAGFEVIRVERARDEGREPPVATGAVALDLSTSPAGTLQAVLDSTRPTVVVNAAGTVTGSARQLADGNVVGPIRLVTAMAATAPTARYIHLGSAAEYGSAGAGRPVEEDDDPQPLGGYGISKLAGSRAVLALADDAGMTASVLRVFNPVGAGSPPSTLPGRLAHLLRTVADGQPLSVGPLDAFRDFVDVRDVAAAVVACTVAAKAPGRIYNVGSGKATGSRELAERLVGIAGFHGSIREQAPPSDRSGALASQQANIDRAAVDLDWSPQHDLTDSLIELWRCAT